jgi:glycosyltransferase involved in cell wall biosynthesis
MKVSIITVAYNAAAMIAETLQSVSAQEHPDIEHIVVDGGSTDGTVCIVQGFPSVSRFISGPDCGIYDAMNKGNALATGDVFGILNADDLYANDRVISTVARVMDQEQLDAVIGDVSFFRSEEPGRVVRRYRSSSFRPSRIAWGWMPAHPALFFHRRVFERLGGYRTDYRIAGDFEFVARAFHSTGLRYRYLPEVFVKMRMGGVSTGGFRNTWLLNREVLKACRDNGIYTNPLMILSKYPLKLLELLRP